MTTSNVSSLNGSSNASPRTGQELRASPSPLGFRSKTTICARMRPSNASLTSQAPAATSSISRFDLLGRNRWMARMPPKRRLMISSSRYARSSSESGRPRSSMISDASTRREKLGISQDEGRVFRTEPDAVGERVSHAHLAGNARNIIEVAFRIGLIQIQSRRDEAFVHRKKNGADSGRTAGALRMANHRFRCAHGNTPGAFSKTVLDGTRLDAVVQNRRRAV